MSYLIFLVEWRNLIAEQLSKIICLISWVANDKPESEVPSPKPEVLSPKSESKIGVQSPKSKFSDWGSHNNHTGHHHPPHNF